MAAQALRGLGLHGRSETCSGVLSPAPHTGRRAMPPGPTQGHQPKARGPVGWGAAAV